MHDNKIMIDIKKVEEKINLLKAGKVLILDHSVYGKYRVTMNQQQNRIFAEPEDDSAKEYEESCKIRTKDGTCHISLDSVSYRIESFIFWEYGDWYLEVQEPTKKVIEVGGVYARI